MAGRGSVKLSIYSTFKDDGTKKAERALAQFAKKYGQVEKATGKVKLNAISKQLAEQSIMWDRVSQKCYKFAGKLDAAAKKFAPFSAAAAAALGGSVKLASDFEQGMAKVATITDKTVISMQEMGDQLLALSTETGVAVTDLTEAAYQAQSASIDSAHAVEFVGNAVNLSKTGFTDTATAVDTLTTVINAYKMEATDAESIANKLVQTQNKGKTTVNELSQSIGQAIPTAAAYGVSLDNLLSSYVLLTKQGINTANATTYLNGMFTELGKEGSNVSKILKSETGKSFTELMNDGNSLGDVLNILYQSVDGDSTAFANLWGNVRAGRGALALAQAGTSEFNAEMEGMATSAGNMQSALEDLETPAFKARKALNALKNTGIVLGQEIIAEVAPALEKMVAAAQRLFEKFKAMPQSTKAAIVRLLGFTAALAPLLKLFASGFRLVGSFAKGMASLTANLAKFAAKGGAAASFAGKFGALLKGPVVLGIMAAAAAIAFIVKKIVEWKQKQENLKKATEGLVNATRPLDMESRNAAASIAEMGDAAGRASVDVDALVEKQAQLADTIAQRNQDAQVEIAMLNQAKDTIHQYANVTGLSAQEQGKLQAAIALVNDECGTQYQVTDAVNGVIKDEEGNILKTTDAIDAYIEKKKEQIRLEAMAEMLKDLYKAQAEAQMAVNDATDEYNAALADLIAHQNEGSAAVAEYSAKVDAAWDKLVKAKDALDSANESAEQGEKSWGKMEKATADADKKLAQVTSTAKTKGAKFAGNFAAGIMANAGKATGAASSMANGAKSAANVNTYSIGVAFVQGFANGINAMARSAASAAASMADSAYRAAKHAIDSKSPSKKMREVGVWFGQGFEQGIDAETANVAQAARGMSNAAMGQFDERPDYYGGGGNVTNIYIDGAKVNDDPAIRSAFMGFMGELRRLAYV